MAESIPVTDWKDLRKFYTKRLQNRDPAKSKLRPIHALDTETYNGNIFLIADSEGKYLDTSITAESVISFLFQKRYQNAWNFFYNLGYDAEVILKLLGTKLNLYRKTGRLYFPYNGYKIHYIPNKCLRIKKGHHSAVFYDIAQFYGGSLVNAFQKNIGKIDVKYLEIKSKRKSFSPTFYRRNTSLVRGYCIQDCKLTKRLAEKWIKLFCNAFTFYPARWISSGYLAEKVLINGKIPIPKFNDMPFDIQDLAWRSYYGGRFEILKRGFIGQAYLYDINSAYPFVFSNIPDITKGKWIKTKKLLENALLGFFKIEAKIPDCKYIPPFPFKTNDKLVFPSGNFITYCTLAELRAYNNPDYYSILESYQYCDDKPFYPYKEFVEAIFSKRLRLKEEKNPLELPLKVILNSIYGKTAQRVGNRIGNLFNPVIASTITGTTRAMLYDFVQRNGIERNVVSFATDSIISTKKLNTHSIQLGKFAFENSGNDVYVLQNGIYRFNGKWKKRGIGNIGNKQIEHLDTIEKDGKLYQVFNLLRVNRLRTAILSDTIDQIGKFKTVERLVNLNADKKRLWFKELKNVNDKIMIDSMPISLSFVDKRTI